MADRRIKGETLIETIAAILVASISSMMLLTAAIAATKVNRSTSSSDEAFLQQQLVAEQQSDDDSKTSTSVTLKSELNGQVYGTYNIARYGKDGELQSYVLVPTETDEGGGSAP